MADGEDDFFEEFGDLEAEELQEIDRFERLYAPPPQAPSRTTSTHGAADANARASSGGVEGRSSGKDSGFAVGSSSSQRSPSRSTVLARSAPTASPKSPTRSTVLARSTPSSQTLRQRTLFGGVAAVPSTSGQESSSSPSFRRTPPGPSTSAGPGMLSQSAPASGVMASFRGAGEGLWAGLSSQSPAKQALGLRKKWDKTAFAQTGRRRRKGRDSETYFEDDDGDVDIDDDETEVVGPVAGLANIPPGPPPPMKLKIDPEAAQTWVYPLNKPKRDYQFNIVQKTLFNNVLVSLPTGLGKTFIAGVVMLNFYRWFPQGKVIFVAPTKPLVAQQVEACHETCGIPGNDAAELTGEKSRAIREEEYATRRVFYMTPQTLHNDLQKGTLDARDIICLVIDEAHRATGNYAYAEIIRFMMPVNPYFRVLALTATPGNHADKVQEVIDNLHIGHIEIRSEAALDIRDYVHKKTEQQEKVELGPTVRLIRDQWAELMNTIMKPLVAQGILHPQDPVLLHAYVIQKTRGNPQKRGLLNRQPWAWTSLKTLQSMARAMQYLVEESVGMFQSAVTELESGGNGGSGKKKGASTSNKLFTESNPVFKDMKRAIESLRTPTGRYEHPKMERLLVVVKDHFESKEREAMQRDLLADLDENGDPPPREQAAETRIMVFCQFRAGVQEIVQALNEGGLRATQFVGQAQDSAGGRGMRQKDQGETIRRFKEGEFNVLVATSIGEEGLDIGEVDLIVCYEAVKDSVRMLQRVGRTGRKREGRIVVLMSEGREEQSWRHAQDAYKHVQKGITAGTVYELYEDCERLVPREYNTRSVEKVVAVEKYVRRRSSNRKVSNSTTGTKRKRNSDPARNMPEGAITTFMTAATLLTSGRGGAKRKGKEKAAEEELLLRLDEDEDDEAIEAGLDSLLTATPSHRPPDTTRNGGGKKQRSLGLRKLRRSDQDAGREDEEGQPSAGEARGGPSGSSLTLSSPSSTDRPARPPAAQDMSWLLSDSDSDEVPPPRKRAQPTLPASSPSPSSSSSPPPSEGNYVDMMDI